MSNQPRFDYDGRGRIIICCEGHEVVAHDGDDESPRWLYRAESPVVGVAVTDAGIVVADRAGTVVNLDLERGAQVAHRSVADELRGLAATPEGAVALLGAHSLTLELPGSGSRTVEAAGLSCAAFSIDGRRLALGEERGSVRVLQLPELAVLGEHRLDGPIADVSAGPDGSWLMACGDRILRMSAEGGSSSRLTGVPGASIGSVLMRRDSRLIGLAFDRKTAVWLCYPSLDTVGTVTYLDKEIESLAFGPHPWVGIGLHTGDGNKWSLVTGSMHRTDTHPEREHHSWLLTQSANQELARSLLAGAPPVTAGPDAAPIADPAAAPESRRWRRFPSWYVAAWALLGVLFLVITLVYRLGGNVQAGSSDLIDRKHDKALFRIDERFAFMVRGPGDVSVVKYCAGTIPFRPLCGLYSVNGRGLNLAMFKKSDWVYSGYPEFGGPAALNLRTGEVIETEKMAHEPGRGVDWARVPFYERKGFTPEPSRRLTPDRVAAEYPSLSTINESCVTYTAAFLLLAGVWLLVGLPLALRRRPRS